MASTLLVFDVHRRACALPLGPVQETLRPLPVEPISGAPAFVLGASVVRGAPAAIIDAGRLISGVPLDTPGRWIILEIGDGRRVGLAVSSVLGVYPARLFDLREAPPLLADAEPAVIQALGRRDDALLSLLMIGRVVPEEVWAALAEAAR